MLNFNPPKPVKCKHCGYDKGQHRAQTFQCPAKWSKSRAVGFTHYLETVYEPKPARGVKVAQPLTEDQIVELGRYWSNRRFAEGAARFLIDFARAIEREHGVGVAPTAQPQQDKP